MYKPIRDWDSDFVYTLPFEEDSELEWKGEGVLKNLDALADVVSAFANYEGGHIVISGAKPTREIPAVPIKNLETNVGKTPLGEWLEDRVRHLVDPPLPQLDVRVIGVEAGRVVALEIRPSDEAPHQVKKTGVFFGRAGSKCFRLNRRQVEDVFQRRKSPVLVISSLQGTERSYDHFRLSFSIHSTSKAVCTSHFIRVVAPLTLRNRPVCIPPDRQALPELPKCYEVQEDSGTWFQVAEWEGRKIYADQSISYALRLYPVSEVYPKITRSEKLPRQFEVKLSSDPLAEIRGATILAVE
jgi:hypothetical protein